MISLLVTLWCCSPAVDAVIIWLLLYLSGADDFTIGDPVVLFSWGGCLQCALCKAGNNNCRERNHPSVHNYGQWMDGGYVRTIEIQRPDVIY